jgi:hypothetical protein
MSAVTLDRTEDQNKSRSLGRIVLIIFVSLITVFALIAAWVWTQRYDMIERQIITYFDSIGIEADLNIQSATARQAEIGNIRLSYDGQPFLKIRRLQTSYHWRELLNGTVKRVDMSGVEAVITVDETGQIVDGWRPPGTGGQTQLPRDGIGLDGASLTLNTPYGPVALDGTGEIQSMQAFELSGTLSSSDLHYEDTQLRLSGPFTLRRQQGPINVELPETTLSLTHPSASLEKTRLDAAAAFTPESGQVEGRVQLTGGLFSTPGDVTGQIDRLALDGRFSANRLVADLQGELRDVTIEDEARVETLARVLSLSNALSDVPIAQNFAPTLIAPLKSLLQGADISTDLTLDIAPERRRLSLNRPMTVRSGAMIAKFSPHPDRPLYEYASENGYFDLATALQVNRPVAMQLDPLTLRVRSNDGFKIETISTATGRLETTTPWRGQTQEGRAARLSPFMIQFDYQNPENAQAQLRLVGQADYDGDIPGGYVDRLRTGGTLIARLSDNQTTVDFTPNQALQIAHLETTSDWTLKAFSGQLIPASPLYERRANQPDRVQTRLSDMSFQAIRPANAEADAVTLDMTIAKADLSGEIDGSNQAWTGQFETLNLRSETFPVPETDLALPAGDIDIRLSADQRTTFDLSTESSSLMTPAYTIRNMALSARGTAEDYALDYKNGRVRLIPQSDAAMQVPVLPVSGSLRFRDGVFQGQAETRLPRVPDNPIQIDYSLIDGQGEADVTITALQFQPRGLQPQDLVPALRGKIAQVDGSIDAQLKLQFGPNTPLSGTGQVQINDVALGTAPGPVTGLSGTVELISLFPVITAPDQRLTIDSFNPGFPLESGTLTYALIPEGVVITDAVFPLGEGKVSFDPFTWIYGADENQVVLRVSAVDVGAFLEELANDKLLITGVLEGTIPVIVRGIDVLVDQGRLEVRDGGVIQYETQTIADNIPNEYAEQAMKALQNFNYDSLFLEIDGPLDGDVTLGVKFTGSNPDVLYNVPFQFDVSVAGELFNIARSLNPSGFQDRILDTVIQSEAENGSARP